jgi:hypothetical protein
LVEAGKDPEYPDPLGICSRICRTSCSQPCFSAVPPRPRTEPLMSLVLLGEKHTVRTQLVWPCSARSCGGTEGGGRAWA